MRVMTCNIRVCIANDGANAWDYRKQLLAEVIRRHDPDVIGFQEMRRPQWAFLYDQLKAYDWFGLARTRDSEDPYNAIFWRRDRFELVSPGGYWLSETPHVTGSHSWDSSEPRLANWVRLVDRETDGEFRFVNTHLDHRGKEARPRQAQVINDDATSFPDEYPQILTGDLNDEPDKPAIECLRAAGWLDTHHLVHGAQEPERTFHGFKGPAFDGPQGKIDYIFVQGGVAARNVQIVKDHDGDLYPSDHYFVLADVALTNGSA